jgi:ABC-type antimicrobial peptide transport system permease subunit
LKTFYTVVGVIGNIRSFGLTAKSPYEFYQTTDQLPVGSITVVLRSSGVEPSSLIPSARSIVASLDPNLPVTRVQTMEEVVSASVGQPRLLSALSGLFGGLAGLLAMVGVYGVTAYNVRRQRREYGIRLALGADPGAVRRLIVRRGATVAAVGIAIGAASGLLLTRVLASMLNDVKPTDPSVFLGNAAIVLFVSMAACYIPARWAGRVDPAMVLRND